MRADTKAEIRNCLQIIRGTAELIKEDSPDGKAIYGASKIIAAVDRITKILEAEHANLDDRT